MGLYWHKIVPLIKLCSACWPSYTFTCFRQKLPRQNAWSFIAQPATHFSYLSWWTHSPLSFFFSQGDISSPYLESLQYFAYFCFSLDTVFSSVAGFPFEVNQVNLQPDKDTVCVCWREEPVKEIGRVCFTMAITGKHVLIPACYSHSRACMVLRFLSQNMHLALNIYLSWLWSAALNNMCVQVKMPLYTVSVTGSQFFSMNAWLLIVQNIVCLYLMQVYRFPSHNSCMQPMCSLSTQTTSIIKLSL